MADGLTTQDTTLATVPSGSKIATDDAGAPGHVQIVKLAIATDGSATLLPGDATDGLLVNLGSNNDVTLGAALPAGTNNIGDVDVLSSALPTGASTAAKQDTMIGHLDGVEGLLTTIDADTGTLAGAVAGTEVQVDVVAALPAGTNTIGAVTPIPLATGGLDIFRSLDLDETEEEVKATAGTLYGWFIANLATTTRFVKFYNATAANVTVGTTTPVMTLAIPGNSTDDIAANALGGIGIKFDTAITVAATSALADADTTAPGANDVVINLFYK